MGRYQVHRSDANADEIIDALRAVGASVEPLGRPVDVAVGFRGVTYLLEIKTRRGAVRPSQRDFLERWRGHAAVVRSADEALKEIGATR